MIDGQNGLIQPSTFCMLFLTLLERVLAWYASVHALVGDLLSHIHVAAVLTCECDLCWCRRPPFSVYPY